MRFNLGICRRDYGRKLKLRSGKYQTQLESRSAESYSNGNEVNYLKAIRSLEGEDWGWEQHIRHYLSEDTTQDASQAYLQMHTTNKWFAEKGVESIIFIEDGARQQ